ncbi:MAG: ComEC/Rec2 family competence protein, partial [Kordiimonas sp.]
MQSYWDKTGLVNIRTHVAKGRVHPEWRLIASVISFCSGAGLATSLWDFSILASSGAVGVSITSWLVLLAVGFKKRCLRTMMFVLLFSCCSGLLVGQLRLISVKQSYVVTTSYADIEGVVERFQIGEGGLARLLMRPTKIGKKVISLPAKLRVSIRTAVDPEVRAGRVVSFSAKLAALNGPMVPGGYNFSRTAFFSGIGAEAIAVSPVKALSGDHGSGFEYWIIEKREQIEAQLLQYISGQAGGVAVALTVGFRNHLSPETTETLRRAGLSHLLAISGLHMGLITGASFFIFEFLFAAFPMAALSVMPRKLAVLPAWLVALSYLFLSGASISTIRAFIMVSVGLLAIVTGRKVFSLRSVALAAFFITLWKPESVLSIGFQMSFAATIGLVAFYENARKGNVGWLKYRVNWFTKLLSYIAAIAVTSIVAQLSVAPFSLFHFQSISAAGVIANIVALPVVSFLVMPSLLLGVFCEAIGGLQLLSGVIKVGLDVVLNVAAETSALPYALLYVAPISIGIFITAVFSLLLLLVYRSALSYGLVVVILLIFVFAQ